MMRALLFTFLLSVASPLVSRGQWTPPATDRQSVTTDNSDVLIAPTAEELITANPELAQEPVYPVFVLTPPDNTFTDFELKITETNFGATGSPEMVYYFHSPGSIPQEIGTEPDVWFTDSQHADVREWRTLPGGTSIAATLANANSVVGGIIVVVTDPAIIRQARNTSLVFSIVWFTATSAENDGNGGQIWRPVVPVSWVTESFTP